MKKLVGSAEILVSRAGEDRDFRERLLASPRETIEKEFGVTLAGDHEIHVHQETYNATHLVLPPPGKLSEAEREAAKTGAASLEFLRKTMYDPAPPLRPPAVERTTPGERAAASGDLAAAGRESIRRGLDFLGSTVDENGAWSCIRFNIADPNIPRHFERPPFVSALCVLALECSEEPQAKALCAATENYLVDTIEFPGLWRYYRHLPPDLDSTALCSLVIAAHPWIFLERNFPPILANRDEAGRFMTWVLAEDEPDVVSRFRIEADPVVNANVIAYLGDRPETADAQRWLETLVAEDGVDGSSKWYPDAVAIYYAIARAMVRAPTALERLRPILADRILELHAGQEGFGNILQTALAVSALYNVGSLERIDAKCETERIVSSQREDGSWPELLAFGDQELKWGTVGQIGHGAEAVTSAFCIEALERLVEILKAG
ncbi:MAG: hypothetical protein F4233_08505 [Rhodospirillaceae bacterium]|nr:hypothetical protein [Rhodospirillaceae bacterium]